MKLYLDTSSPRTILKLDDSHYEWDSSRDLGMHLLKFIHDKLAQHNRSWQDLTELHFFTGPGSFTGLRIGATIINTLASELHLPIYDQTGQKLKIAIPIYGKPAATTMPKK